MRLTLALCKQPLRWHRKNVWLYRGRFKKPTQCRPEFFKRGGINLVDLPTYLAPPPRFPPWTPPVPDDPRFQPEPKLSDHPDYHDEPIYTFNQSTNLIEGLQQAQVLTKTHLVQGLPKSIQANMGVHKIPKQDDIIQQYIMQAHVWDTTQERIVRERLPKTPVIWQFKAERSIPQPRSSLILIRNMMRFCDMLLGPDNLLQRRTYYGHQLENLFNRGDDKVYVSSSHERLVCSQRPLPVFADPELLDESVTVQLPQLYPLLPTIDLKKSHIYREAWSSPKHPHTITHLFTDPFSQSARNAQALMYSFAHCVNMAKNLYGDASQLPEPITVQFIGCDGVTFTFLCYQLNTLDVTSESGVKNVAWLDVSPIMDKQLPKRAMLRNTKYVDYDPDVIEKVKAMAFSGLDLRANARQEAVNS